MSALRLSFPPRPAVMALAAVVIFGNALGVVYSAAHNRALFSELSTLRQQHNRLVVRRGQLELEEWTLAAHARVARLAQEKLDMQAPAKVHIVEVR